MSKKLHSKLLSVILCIAICCATLCGTIIAVNAATADFNGTYTITVGDEKQAVPFGTTETKVQVKFDLPAGFAGGEFIAKSQSVANDYTFTAGNTATVVAGTAADGSAFDADAVEAGVEDSGSDKNIYFVLDKMYTSVTVEYTLVFTTGYVKESTSKTGYVVSIDVDGSTFGVENQHANVTFTGSDSAFHAHCAWFDPDIIKGMNEDGTLFPNGYSAQYVTVENEKNGKHTVASASCPFCEEVASTKYTSYTPGWELYKRNIQIFPDITEFDGKTTLKSTTGWAGISGITVRYNDDGALTVDVHYYAQHRTGTVDLLICDKEGNELYRIANSTKTASYYAGNGLHASETMFTITGLSAKDIETELLLTLVEYGDGANIWLSRTMPFCLADYCEKVVTGESAVWASGATEDQIEADKDVAAALYYYGASIEPSVFEKNEAPTGSDYEVNYTKANYSEWTGNKTQPQDTDAEGNVIINTADEFAWIALQGGDATSGVNYKVADNSVFNMMGMEGIGLNSTLADVKAATKSTTMLWRLDADGSSPAFQGNFDGNGLTVYNIYTGTGRSHCGLFPATNSTAQGSITIENVTVAASYIGAYHGAGALIGIANTSNTSTKMFFEKCVVKNCFIYDNDDANPATKKIGGILAGEIGHNAAIINNCLAIDNEIDSQGIQGGFFGNNSNFAGQSTVTNSITIGSSAAPVSIGTALATKVETTTYTNVYESASAQTGEGAVAAMGLGSDWFDTASYPELSIFHILGKKYVDNNIHKIICVLKANGVACNTACFTEAHTLTVNKDGTAKVCECGYSVPILKQIEYIGANYSEWTGNKTQPQDTDAEGNVIINTADEFAWIALQGGDATAGVNYKVATNSVFNMMGMEGINLNSTATDVKNAKQTTKYWVQDSAVFKGTLDGNGVVIYNVSSQKGQAYGGLFPKIDNVDTSISNITVKASAFYGYHQVGGIVGLANGQKTINIEKCVVKDCYLACYTSNDATSKEIGTIVGKSGNCTININNCLVADNTIGTACQYAVNISGGFVANASAYAPTAFQITNSISIGTSPYPTVVGTGTIGGDIASKAVWSNVYTDQTVSKDGITTLTLEQMTGEGAVAAMGLGSDWFDTASYPELSIFHVMTDEYVDDNTHKPICIIVANGQYCTVCGVPVDHVLSKNEEGTANVCDCGYSEEIVGNVVVPTNINYSEWSGNKTKPENTDAEGNVIINTADEFAWIALQGGDTTSGVNYKVADRSVFNMMGMEGITLNSTATDVKNANQTTNYWKQDSAVFKGTLDGNGVVIYNVSSQKGQAYGGLFPKIDNVDTSISNIIVKASAFYGYHQVGGIVGLANGQKTINIENCAVKDCYLACYTSNDATSKEIGTIVGKSGNCTININNCLVADNTIGTACQYAVNISGGFVANASAYAPTAFQIKNSISIGTSPYPTVVGTGSIGGDISSKAVWSNVYTDQTVSKDGITTLTLDQMTGEGAVAAMGLDDNWFDNTSYPELKIFHDMATIYVDEDTHQTVCQVTVDGVRCPICTPIEEHELIDADDGKSTNCECGYGYAIIGINSLGLPESVLNRITSTDLYIEKFATNSAFMLAYDEDNYHDITNASCWLYASSLNLKVNPHIAFTFVFDDSYRQSANVSVTFKQDGEVITTVTAADMTNNAAAGKYHLYRLTELSVTKLCKPVTVECTYGGKTENFGTYSAAGYAIAAMYAGADFTSHVNAAMSLVYYSEMLAARGAGAQ